VVRVTRAPPLVLRDRPKARFPEDTAENPSVAVGWDDLIVRLFALQESDGDVIARCDAW